LKEIGQSTSGEASEKYKKRQTISEAERAKKVRISSTPSIRSQTKPGATGVGHKKDLKNEK